jgi:hypothetical protein
VFVDFPRSVFCSLALRGGVVPLSPRKPGAEEAHRLVSVCERQPQREEALYIFYHF